MNIEYINRVPTKMEVNEILDSMLIDVTGDILIEDENTVTSVCACHLDRVVGVGKVQKGADNKLYIEAILVKPEYTEEGVENGIIVALIKQVNELKRFNPSIQSCLDMEEKEENFFNKFSFLNKMKQELGA